MFRNSKKLNSVTKFRINGIQTFCEKFNSKNVTRNSNSHRGLKYGGVGIFYKIDFSTL